MYGTLKEITLIQFVYSEHNRGDATSPIIHHFKSFSQVMSTRDEKVRFIKGNEIKLTQVDLLLFFFLRVHF